MDIQQFNEMCNNDYDYSFEQALLQESVVDDNEYGLNYGMRDGVIIFQREE